MTTFAELPIGEHFDFISPKGEMNSFFERCIKSGARTYIVAQMRDHTGAHRVFRVGSIHAKVYHVGLEGFTPKPEDTTMSKTPRFELPDHTAAETFAAMNELCLAISPRAHMSIVIIDGGDSKPPLRWALRPEGYYSDGREPVLSGRASNYRETLRDAFHAWVDHHRTTSAQPEEVQP